MRLFRTEEAAREAGLKIIAMGHPMPAVAYCKGGDGPIEILTDRERRLLQALERAVDVAALYISVVENGDPLHVVAEDKNDIGEAKALICELAVEG